MKRLTERTYQTIDHLTVANTSVFLACFILKKNLAAGCSVKHAYYLLCIVDKFGK